MTKLIDVLKEAIIDNQKPIISKFEIFFFGLQIVENKNYNNLKIKKQKFDIEKNNRLILDLIDKRFISNDIDFTSYYKITSEAVKECSEVCCLIDPFCYISHLSAMQKYGFTNRISEFSILTRPQEGLWKKMKEEFKNDYINKLSPDSQNKYIFPQLKRAVFPKKVRKMQIKVVESKFIHPSILIRDSYARITDIGHTFLDMLINPELCGGMSHIIEVWKQNAKKNIDLIIKAVDNHPQDIVKCRAGYIVEDILKIKDNKIINKWLRLAQRGGSRLLDPNSNYSSKFSERWKISINI